MYTTPSVSVFTVLYLAVTAERRGENRCPGWTELTLLRPPVRGACLRPELGVPRGVNILDPRSVYQRQKLIRRQRDAINFGKRFYRALTRVKRTQYASFKRACAYAAGTSQRRALLPTAAERACVVERH